MPERLAYNPAEVAELTGIPVGEVRRMCRTGEIPAKRRGQRWLIPAASLRKWIGVAA